MANIPYRIESVRTPQFAIFPDKYVNGKDVEVTTSFNFFITKTLDHVRCLVNVVYAQGEDMLLTTDIECIFLIAPDGIKVIKEEGRLTTVFLRYMATIATGTARGVISAKTEGTVLNPIVLPPTNLVNVIKDDLMLKDLE